MLSPALRRSEEGVPLNELCPVVSSVAIDREPALESAEQVGGVSMGSLMPATVVRFGIAFMQNASRGDVDNVRKTGNDRI
jgi:hypothetical protein